MSADVDVLFPVPPTPSAAVHDQFPAVLFPCHSTLAVAVVQLEPVPCRPRVGRQVAEVARVLSLNNSSAVEPLYTALLYSHSVRAALLVSTQNSE